MRATAASNHGCVRNQRVVDTGERHQVGLELGQVDIESAVEAKTGSDGADHLGDQTVQMLVARAGDIQVAAADVVDSFIIHQESAVGVLNGAVRGQDRVVRLDDGGGHARRGVDSKFQLGFLAIVGRKALEQQGAKSGAGTTTEGMEDEEALERGTAVCSLLARLSGKGSRLEFGRTGNTANAVNHVVNELLSDGVVATSICYA